MTFIFIHSFSTTKKRKKLFEFFFFVVDRPASVYFEYIHPISRISSNNKAKRNFRFFQIKQIITKEWHFTCNNNKTLYALKIINHSPNWVDFFFSIVKCKKKISVLVCLCISVLCCVFVLSSLSLSR